MIFASNNPGKIKEVKEIFNNYEILSLNDLKIDIDILEDGNNYYENAYIKAKKIFELTGIPTIADDSGLEILALNRYPNIHTKRLCPDEYKRNMMLIEKTKDLEDKRIEAVCTIVYVDKDKVIEKTGRLKGYITDKIYEGNGFGFDKIFRLPNGKVISELSREEKNKISARSIALNKLKHSLENRG